MKAKTFDCVNMKRKIQEQTRHETESMSPEMREEFIRRRSEEFLRRLASRPGLERFAVIADKFARTEESKGRSATNGT